MKRILYAVPSVSPEDLLKQVIKTGHVPWITPTLGRGIVIKIHLKCVTMKLETAFIRSYFYQQVLPLDVREGERITVIGDLCSCNGQERYYLRNCLLIPEGFATLKRELYRVLELYTLKPSEYMSVDDT